MKIYSKFTGKHPCRSMISINLLCQSTYGGLPLGFTCSPQTSIYRIRTTFSLGRNICNKVRKPSKKHQKSLIYAFAYFVDTIYRRTPMPKCDFNKVAGNFIETTLWHWCSPVNLLQIFRTHFSKNTSERLFLILKHPAPVIVTHRRLTK